MSSGTDSRVTWQRALRRRQRTGVPPDDDAFWAPFFEGTQTLAGFDEPSALTALLHAEPHLPADVATRAAFTETLAETRFLLNDYRAAAEGFDQAREAWTAAGDALAAAEVQGWLGACFVQQGAYQDGLLHLHAAIEHCARLGQRPRAARALNYLAILYEELGDLPLAHGVYEEALQAARDDGDADMEGRVLANHGEACVVAGEIERGLPLLSRAVDVLKGIGAHWHYGWCLLAIGRVHRDRGDQTRALEFHLAAREAVERGHSPRARVEVYAGLGELHSRGDRHDDAVTWLHQALELARHLGIKREVFKTHRLLSEAWKRAGDFQRALEHHEAFHAVRSEVFDQLARERVATLRAEFELAQEKQARELERLRTLELAGKYAALEERARTLSDLSQRDGLTGLYNRRHFDEVLPLELARCRGFSQPLSLVLLDIDHFKRINDGYSHVTGDAVLKRVAQSLGRELRQSDLAARYGGEEFVLLLPHTALDGGRIAAEKVRLAIATCDWTSLTPGFGVTASLGVAEATAHDTPSSLIRRADEALYEAKRSGRNRVRAAVRTG